MLPPVVYDAAGRDDVTPQGTHWSLERRGSSRFLVLRVDDSSLPLPYVIDPITVVGSPAWRHRQRQRQYFPAHDHEAGRGGDRERPDEGRPAEDHDVPRRRTTRSRSQNVVSISDGRTTQGLRKGLKHVRHLTPDQAFLYASYHDVRVIVVDADLYGRALARDLHQVFPSATVVALSKNVGRRAALTSKGIVAVPASTPPAQVAALVARLLRGLNH